MAYTKADMERDRLINEINRDYKSQNKKDSKTSSSSNRNRASNNAGQKEPLILKVDTAIRNAIWGKGNW